MLDTFYLILGILVIAVDVFFVIGTVNFGGLFWVMLLIGIMLVASSIIGFYGSGYAVPVKSDRFLFLAIFYILALVFSFFFAFVSIYCLTNPKSAESIFQGVKDGFDKMGDDIFSTTIKNIFNALNISHVGIILVIFTFFVFMSYFITIRIFDRKDCTRVFIFFFNFFNFF